jgi:Ca2+-binding RTX toxin-like protein
MDTPILDFLYRGRTSKVAVALAVALFVAAVLLSAPALAKFVQGTSGPDRLVGTDRADLIDARGGNDSVRALAGDDTVVLANGDDTGRGGDGNDVIRGAEGNDTLFGGPGEDRLSGGNGNDIIDTGGRDRRSDEVNCGPGEDEVFLSANDHSSNNLDNCEIVHSV